jgi:4-aminobutyrate aminotransferase
MGKWKPGTHGGTYGGNVVSCAAANATLDVIADEDLVANAAERGAQFLDGLRDLKGKYRSIGDARGLGLMVALEFVKSGEGDGRVPDPSCASSRRS